MFECFYRSPWRLELGLAHLLLECGSGSQAMQSCRSTRLSSSPEIPEVFFLRAVEPEVEVK